MLNEETISCLTPDQICSFIVRNAEEQGSINNGQYKKYGKYIIIHTITGEILPPWEISKIIYVGDDGHLPYIIYKIKG